MTPEEIYTLWRAIGELTGITTKFALNGQRVLLHTLHHPSTTMAYKNWERFETMYAPGQLKFDIVQNLLFIKCKVGWIACSRLSVDHKPTNKAVHFANGYHIHNAKEPREEFKFVKFENNKD
jgi:methionyl-tRNA formyltransferase